MVDKEELTKFVGCLERLVNYWKTQKQTKRIQKLIKDFSESIDKYKKELEDDI